MGGRYILSYKGKQFIFDFEKHTYQDASCVCKITDSPILEANEINSQPIFVDFYKLLKLNYNLENGLDYDRDELARITSRVSEYIESHGDEQVSVIVE